MRSVLAAMAVVLACGVARADGPPACGCGRVATIPAWMEKVSRTEKVRPVLQERQRAICEVCEEAIYETRCVPATVSEIVPIYELKATPIYQTRKTPIFGEVDVPVYAVRTKPVKVPWVNPCSCKEKMATLWQAKEKVQVGTKRERRCLGYKEEKVQVGTRNERVRCGQEVRTRTVGWTTERVCVGTRPVTRIVDWQPDWAEVCPETTRTVVDLVPHPARTVTVVPDGTPRVVLPGTETCLTEAEFLEASRAASQP